MKTLINALELKKSNLENILNTINSKNNGDIETYTSKELKRCAMMVKQIKSVDIQLNEYRSNILKIS